MKLMNQGFLSVLIAGLLFSGSALADNSAAVAANEAALENLEEEYTALGCHDQELSLERWKECHEIKQKITHTRLHILELEIKDLNERLNALRAIPL